MSDVTQRMLPVSDLHRWTRRLPATAELVPSLLLVGVGVALARRWWTEVQAVTVPLSRGVLDLPLAGYAYQIPGLAVVGLLLVQALASAGRPAPAAQHLSEMASRWAGVWVATSAVGLALTASRLTGVSVPALTSREDLFAVIGRSDQAITQVTTLWVALLIAFFGNRLTSPLQTCALAVVAAVALLPVLENVPGSGHGPASQHAGADLHGLAMVALAVQLLAVVVWFGGLAAVVVHLRVVPALLNSSLVRFSYAASLCMLLIGSAGLVQGALRLPSLTDIGTTPPGQLLLAKAVALVLLVTVGFRHRRRTAEACANGRLFPLLGLASGELVLVGAVVAITMLITPAF